MPLSWLGTNGNVSVIELRISFGSIACTMGHLGLCALVTDADAIAGQTLNPKGQEIVGVPNAFAIDDIVLQSDDPKVLRLASWIPTFVK
jgi:hypothetical protein